MRRTRSVAPVLILILASGCSRADSDRVPAEVGEESAAVADAPAPSAVTAYAAFVDSLPPTAEGEQATTLVAEGLERLAGAFGERGLGGTALNVNLRVAATHLRLSPQSAEVTQLVRQHLLDAAQAAPGAEGEAITRRVRALDAEQPLAQQYDAVRLVFAACRAVLGPTSADRVRRQGNAAPRLHRLDG